MCLFCIRCAYVPFKNIPKLTLLPKIIISRYQIFVSVQRIRHSVVTMSRLSDNELLFTILSLLSLNHASIQEPPWVFRRVEHRNNVLCCPYTRFVSEREGLRGRLIKLRGFAFIACNWIDGRCCFCLLSPVLPGSRSGPLAITTEMKSEGSQLAMAENKSHGCLSKEMVFYILSNQTM